MADNGAVYVAPKVTLKEKLDSLFWMLVILPISAIFLLVKFLITFPFKIVWKLIKNNSK